MILKKAITLPTSVHYMSVQTTHTEKQYTSISSYFQQLSDGDSSEFLDIIFKHLETIANSKRDKNLKLRMYFSGEFDSNQTTFEEQSNHLEIGVIARSKRVAGCMLMILRMIVDDNYNLLSYVLEDYKNRDKMNLDRLVNILARTEYKYMTIAPLHKKATVLLVGSTIEKYADEIKLYTLPHLYQAAMDTLF